MNKNIILLAVPVLLLSSCTSTSSQVDYNDWFLAARTLLNNVDKAVKANDYPFTKYTMKGNETRGELVELIDCLYTYAGEGNNWWTMWNYEDKTESISPTRYHSYELYTAEAFCIEYVQFIQNKENTFKWYKSGNNLSVEFVYKNDVPEHKAGKFTFNQSGFISSISLSYPDSSNLKVTIDFSYSK